MVWPRRPGWGRRGGVMGSAPGREAGQRRVGGKIHGQQRLEVFDGASLGEIGEDPAQVMIGLKPYRLAGLDEAIEVGGGLRAGFGVTEEPIPSTKTEGSNRILGRIIPRHGLFRLARMERDFGLVVRH